MFCKGLEDDTVSILIGGEAGQGITRSGSILGKSLMRGGLHVFGTSEYPSLIRGGHNYYLLRASTRIVNAQTDKLDIVIALNKETALIHESEINQGGYIIIDETAGLQDNELKRRDIQITKIPMKEIVKELGGPEIMSNTVALGAVTCLLGLDNILLMDTVAATFAKKEVADMNRLAVDRGYNYTKTHCDRFKCSVTSSEDKSERILLSGNEALSLGAISAGCRFYAAYPMTPASSILDYMTAHDAAADMVVIQAESEIAAMNMVVGAGYAGLRAMTATSGGGFSLMTEALGFGAITETPLVVNVGQRPGPSTGLATHTAQGDLLFVIHASQGEFIRVVVAPGDIDECFYYTKQAFNLAEMFQIPVIILTDKYLAESERDTLPFDGSRVPIDRGKLVIDKHFDGSYKRYEITEDGVSPRVLPGTLGAIVASNSNEHKDNGRSTSNPDEVKTMIDKRFRKHPHIEKMISSLEPVKIIGDNDAEVTVVGWGGMKGPILEAIELLKMDGVKARLLQVIFMEPFPSEQVKTELGKTKINILIENNKTAQLGTLIKLNSGIKIEHVGLRYDGRPFMPSEIKAKVLEVLRK
jgi:2-oxoglutarate/2-oxoacid ferredoxin oxidoreductase subunit alpha